jgi:hypothetical protein
MVKAMNKHPKPIINIYMRSRNIKNIIDRVKPSEIIDNYTKYLVKENTTYTIIAYGKPVYKTITIKRKDLLSGLTFRIMEKLVIHGNKPLIHIYWDGSYYRVKILETPYAIKIVMDNNSNH